MSDNKTALVTGANGFVGSNLCEQLLARGYRVKALVRPTSNTDNLEGVGVEMTHGQISEPESLAEPFADVDIVFHVAGAVRERKKGDFMRINRDATETVTAACANRAGRPPRLVLISSLAAAGPAEDYDRPNIEANQPQPMSDYGRSKLAGEEAARKYQDQVEISILRPPIVYGPRDTDFYDVFKMAQRGWVLKPGFSKKLYSMIHAVDLAIAAILISEKGETISDDDVGRGVYFINDGQQWAWEELASETAKALGKSTRVLPLPASLTYVVATFAMLGSAFTKEPPILNYDKANEIQVNTWICSSEKIEQELGWKPEYPLPVGLEHTARWYREKGMLR